MKSTRSLKTRQVNVLTSVPSEMCKTVHIEGDDYRRQLDASQI
jgi:hypothetical protein